MKFDKELSRDKYDALGGRGKKQYRMLAGGRPPRKDSREVAGLEEARHPNLIDTNDD